MVNCKLLLKDAPLKIKGYPLKAGHLLKSRSEAMHYFSKAIQKK